MGIRLGVIDTISPEHSRDGAMPSEVSIAGAYNDREPTVEELKQELDEAREERAALAEVLRVIASSPGELQPVFHAMLTNAVRLCGGKLGDLYLCEADGFRMAASHNAPPAYVEARTREPVLRPPPDAPLSRLAVTKQIVQIADIKTIPSYIEGHPFVRAAVDLAGYRTVLTVPMLKGDQLIGAIAIGGSAVHRQADCTCAELRRSGRHCNREHAAAQQAARIVAAADRHL
jgi:two-component system NtrC family sensor kinase